jgi:hypothetical protein
MIPVVIKGLEGKRIENQQLLNKAEEEMKTAEQMYLDAKQAYQAVLKEQEEFDRGYQALLAFQENPGAEMLFYDSKTEAAEPKGGKTERKYRWVSRAADVLREANHFMRPEFVLNAIFKSFPEYKESLREFNSGEQAAKTRIIKSMEKTAKIVNRSRGKQELCMFKNKFGLVEWMDLETMQPKPQYLTSFVHTENTILTAHNGAVPEALVASV